MYVCMYVCAYMYVVAYTGSSLPKFGTEIDMPASPSIPLCLHLPISGFVPGATETKSGVRLHAGNRFSPNCRPRSSLNEWSWSHGRTQRQRMHVIRHPRYDAIFCEGIERVKWHEDAKQYLARQMATTRIVSLSTHIAMRLIGTRRRSFVRCDVTSSSLEA